MPDGALLFQYYRASGAALRFTEKPPTITACLPLADGRHWFPNQCRPFSFSTLTTLLTRCRTQVDPRLLRRKTEQFWMESSPAGFALLGSVKELLELFDAEV